jgi:hypothetical protein
LADDAWLDAEGITAPANKRPRRFHGVVKLDETRVSRDAGRIYNEIIHHLVTQLGAEVEVTLEIHARLPEGAPDAVVRTVTENARTLKFDGYWFEAEQMTLPAPGRSITCQDRRCR